MALTRFNDPPIVYVSVNPRSAPRCSYILLSELASGNLSDL